MVLGLDKAVMVRVAYCCYFSDPSHISDISVESLVSKIAQNPIAEIPLDAGRGPPQFAFEPAML